MKGDLLLIIDMQNVYDKGGEWECMDAAGAADNIRRIVESGTVDSAIITKFIASESPHVYSSSPSAKGAAAHGGRSRRTVSLRRSMRHSAGGRNNGIFFVS